MEDGAELSRVTVRRALEGQGLKFEGFKSEKLAAAETGYSYALKGAG